MSKIKYKNNYKFIDSAILNDMTYIDYLNRLRKVAMSIFEWVNLPNSMDGRYLEYTLYQYGQATLLKDKKLGFINTKCSSNGEINIYGLPTRFNCYSYNYKTTRKLYTGLLSDDPKEIEKMEYNDCILVMNNWDSIPTDATLGLFAYRLYQAERTTDVNINAQKTPCIVTVDDKQRLTIINLMQQYDGNTPLIIGDKNQVGENFLKAVKTDAPFLAKDLQEYKKEIWNEALTFLGINNIMIDKKERLVSDEANSNNELINLNLQSYFVPRQTACEQFNEKYGLKGTNKEISVRLRSDLHNIIKNEMSGIKDLKNNDNINNEEGEE